jgi:hypothetical protein
MLFEWEEDDKAEQRSRKSRVFGIIRLLVHQLSAQTGGSPTEGQAKEGGLGSIA